MFDYDAELVRYQTRLCAAADATADDRVLDIGCGAGQTTREAASAAVAGSACGVDISGPMVARARWLAASEQIRNISFLSADAQVHLFPPGHFSLGISRFGTMFFTDPVAAFANIAQALCSDARLVQLVWQASDRQEWYGAIAAALAVGPPKQTFGDPFSLADPARTAGVLTAAGFIAVDITEVREPICHGPDADSALDAVLGLQMAKDRIADMDAAEAERVRERLRAALDAHDTGDGVWFDSCAWLVTARRSRREYLIAPTRRPAVTTARTSHAAAPRANHRHTASTLDEMPRPRDEAVEGGVSPAWHRPLPEGGVTTPRRPSVSRIRENRTSGLKGGWGNSPALRVLRP